MNRIAVLALILCAAPAWAEPAASPFSGGGLSMLTPWVLILFIFYFFLIRPQQKQAKQHRQMLEDLKRGDRVLTQGGLYGVVQAIKGKVLEVKISENTKVLVARSHISQVVQGDPTAIEAEPVSNGAPPIPR